MRVFEGVHVWGLMWCGVLCCTLRQILVASAAATAAMLPFGMIIPRMFERANTYVSYTERTRQTVHSRYKKATAIIAKKRRQLVASLSATFRGTAGRWIPVLGKGKVSCCWLWCSSYCEPIPMPSTVPFLEPSCCRVALWSRSPLPLHLHAPFSLRPCTRMAQRSRLLRVRVGRARPPLQLQPSQSCVRS